MNKTDFALYCPFHTTTIQSNATGGYNGPAFLPCLLTGCMAFELDNNEIRSFSGETYVRCKCLRLHRNEDDGVLINTEAL